MKLHSFRGLIQDLGDGVPWEIIVGIFFCDYWVDRCCSIQFTGV